MIFFLLQSQGSLMVGDWERISPLSKNLPKPTALSPKFRGHDWICFEIMSSKTEDLFKYLSMKISLLIPNWEVSHAKYTAAWFVSCATLRDSYVMHAAQQQLWTLYTLSHYEFPPLHADFEWKSKNWKSVIYEKENVWSIWIENVDIMIICIYSWLL